MDGEGFTPGTGMSGSGSDSNGQTADFSAEIQAAVTAAEQFNRNLDQLIADAIKQIQTKTTMGVSSITEVQSRALVMILDARNSALAAINAGQGAAKTSRRGYNPSGPSVLED
jgi:hypothetical protein